MKEEHEELEGQEEQEEWHERDKKTKGKEAPTDKGKKLRRGILIFRQESREGFIERLAI